VQILAACASYMLCKLGLGCKRDSSNSEVLMQTVNEEMMKKRMWIFLKSSKRTMCGEVRPSTAIYEVLDAAQRS
jgi:hypothetical protein